MAHIKIDKREFDELAGEEIDEEKLHEEASFLGAHWNHIEGPKWDVEVYPNRPDLLSVEGLARSYRGFFGIDTGRPEYEVNDGSIQLEKEESVEAVRPHIGCAVVRDLELSEKVINGLIQLQEKLHETMGRKRDKLAIGLHDLESIEPPFVYRAVKPEKVSFKPLEHDREMALGEILDEHDKGQEYAWILEDEDRYPVIVDSEDQVLSFPPIINNQLTEVEHTTEDIFIDVTGKDLPTVKRALNILATALAERGGEIEAVEVDGEEMPDLTPKTRKLEVDYFKRVSGIDVMPGEIVERLEMMNYGAEAEGGVIEVEIPAYRNDIMHQYDLIEDVVIAHRYDNIEPEIPEIDQVADQERQEEYVEVMRDVMQGCGALETHTYALSSQEKLFENMNVEPEQIVEMSNPLTEDHSCVRNWLLPSLMNVLRRNRHRSYPQKFFEVAEVAHLDESDTGASNSQKLAYVESDEDVDFNDARRVLQTLERDLGLEFEIESGAKNCFKADRSAEIKLAAEKVGVIGEFSTAVIDNWELDRNVAGFELDVEKVVEHIRS